MCGTMVHAMVFCSREVQSNMVQTRDGNRKVPRNCECKPRTTHRRRMDMRLWSLTLFNIIARLEPATQCVGASVPSAKVMSEVNTWRLQHCRHRGANKDGHSSLLLKPGFIQVHVYTSPKDQQGPGEVDCECTVEGGRQSGCERVLHDGSWAGLVCVMSSLQPIFLLKIHSHRQTSGKLFCLETFVSPSWG